ncbi:hypothetical protein CF392_05250 [Tamilnaduibacter salinus]|uniref:Lipase chaperone n=1 Tax=Tamilnaduibacter salinus TaxID=1484056 RepID=A0A2A2I6E6_9GAMM|nr:lipase secretion chaperone [Tamilnaduibacter salinus]PAV26613.1 hypothetical protein CF392_05250 [Tamilnaduibacter salinus]
MAFFVSVFVVLAGGFWLVVGALSVEPGTSVGSSDAPAGESTELNGGDPALPTGSLARYAREGRQQARPESLEGTRVDGSLTTDAAGNLKLTPDVRRVFEYFLSTIGEVDPENASALLAAHIESSLPPKAASQAWDLFLRYLDMKQALSEMPAHDGTVSDMEATLAQRQAIRESVLGAEAADAFFGMAHQYSDYRLSRQAIQENPDLSATERQRQLDQLRDNAPERIRSLLTQPDSPAAVSQAVSSMRQEGVSDQAIQAYRMEKLGPEAARRLEQLDQQREQWQQRYDQYRQERQAILNSGLAAPDRQEAIQRLRDRHFDESQRRRVEALDRIRASESSDQAAGATGP